MATGDVFLRGDQIVIKKQGGFAELVLQNATSGLTGGFLKNVGGGLLEFDIPAPGAAAWGSITGTLSAQTDLDTALNARQPLDTDLTAIAGLTASNDDIIQRKAGVWTNRTLLQYKTDLSLNLVENTALSTWPGSTNITTLGTIVAGIWNAQAIAISKGGVPAGGLTGQVLKKLSNTDYDYSWGTDLDTGGGGGISDGDKGDITLTGLGTIWTIDNDAINSIKIINSAVTNAKIATGIDAIKLADGSVSNTEFQYINTLTSNAQTQLDGKMAPNIVNIMGSSGRIAFPSLTTDSVLKIGSFEIQGRTTTSSLIGHNVYFDGTSFTHRATGPLSFMDINPTATSFLFGMASSATAGSAATVTYPLGVYSTGIIVGIPNGYVNFDSVTGTSGYGFRSNGGTMQWKNSGGSWVDISAGGGGGSGTINSGSLNRLTYYAGAGTTVSELAALTADRALISDANGLPVHSNVTAATLAFLDATSSIQTQINTKQANLVSGTNIRTVNGNTLLGSTDLVIATTSTIYVSPSGVGTGSGSTPATAVTMAGLIVLSASFIGGERIYFEAGGTYSGKVIVKSNTYIGKYGDGAAPIISGTVLSTSVTWTQAGAVWSAPYASRVGQLLRNVARERTAQSAFYTITANGGNTLTASTATGLGAWVTDAELISKEYVWRWTFNEITAYNSGTGEFTLNTNNGAVAGHQFRLFNHQNLITTDGDWAWVAGTVYYQSPGNVNPNTLNVELSVYDEGIFIEEDATNIVIDGLQFFGQAIDGIYGKNITNIAITNCKFDTIQSSGILLAGDCRSLLVDNNIFSKNGFNGLGVFTAVNFVFTRNTVTDLGVQVDPPFTRQVTARYGNLYSQTCGIMVSDDSKYGEISDNVIDNVSYIGIRSDGQDVKITRNKISNHGQRTNDGAGIYANGWRQTALGAVQRLEVSNNIVWGGVSSTEGAPISQNFTMGIYFDAGVETSKIIGNTVYDNDGFGIFIGVSNEDNEVTGNVSYNNGEGQLAIYSNATWDTGATVTDGIQVSDNTFVGLNNTQKTVYIYDGQTASNNPFAGGGFIKNNIFVQPYLNNHMADNTTGGLTIATASAIYNSEPFGQKDAYTGSFVDETTSKGLVPLQVNTSTSSRVTAVPEGYHNPINKFFDPLLAPMNGTVFITGSIGGAGSQWTTAGSDIYYNLGNVGIGDDTSPNNLLHVEKNHNASTNIYLKNMTAGAGSYVSYFAESDAGYLDMGMTSSTTTPFGPYASGNAVIATNQPFTFMTSDTYINWATVNIERLRLTSVGLQMDAAYFNFSTTAGTTGFGFWNDAGTMKWKNSGGSWAAFGAGGSSQWTDVTGGINYSSGKIGIGQATLTHWLDILANQNAGSYISIANVNVHANAVAGSAFTTDAGTLYMYQNSTLGGAYGGAPAGGGILYSANHITIMADASGKYINFAAGGSAEIMRITSIGVGIGTAPGTGIDLHIKKAAATSVWIESGAGVSDYSQILFGETTIASGKYAAFERYSNASTLAGAFIVSNLTKSIIFSTLYSSGYRNDIIINSSGAIGFNNLFGTAAQVLTSAGSGAAPTWETVPISIVSGRAHLNNYNSQTTYDNDTLAGAGGVAQNSIYHTTTGVLMIKL